MTVLNDDWGAVSLDSGRSVSTGEKMLHMKSSSVLALCPGFFESAPPGSYSRDLSEPDRAARILVLPEGAYGTAWSTTAAVIKHVAVVVREPASWLPSAQGGEAVMVFESEGVGLVHHHEAFFNGSLILTAEDDKLREERRYRQLVDRTKVSWINNCGTPEDLLGKFIAAVM
jgi:hypothetical protein